jgi:O-antigen/teichoic acid export membrane protein
MTGTFAIADKAAGVFQLFPVWLFVISALPRLSYMYEHDREQCLRVLATYQRWTSIYALITLPIALFCAPWIIYAFSGSFNEEATMFFRVLCLETFILTVNIFLIHYFPISGQFGTFAKIYGVTCIVTLILFIVLSHFMGVFGIVLSILLSAIFVLLLTLYHRSAEVSLKN